MVFPFLADELKCDEYLFDFLGLKIYGSDIILYPRSLSRVPAPTGALHRESLRGIALSLSHPMLSSSPPAPQQPVVAHLIMTPEVGYLKKTHV